MAFSQNISERTIPSNCAAVVAVVVDLRPSPYDDVQDYAVAAVVVVDVVVAMIDDYVMTAAVVWNFSLSSSSVPDRWSAVDPAVHCRRTALVPGRSVPPSRLRIPGAL